MTDVITFGPDRPPRRRPRWLVPLAVAALLAAAAGGFLVTRRGTPPVPTTTASATAPDQNGIAAPTGIPCAPASPAPDAAPDITGLVIGQTRAGGTLERCDRTAAAGPWTVVVRAPDGSPGRHGAVVTYPVPAPVDGPPSVVGGPPGPDGINAFRWPIGDGYARIRGDLGADRLAAIVAHTSIRNGRPSVDPPPGLSVVSTGPYRPLVISEARYGADALGERPTFGGGLIFTGLTTGGGYEDQLFAQPATDSGTVNGHPAVVSGAFPGNGALAWEPVPGTIAYVGYSGAPLDAATVAALHRLADRSRILAPDQWRRTQPQVLDQPNDPG